MRLEFQQLRVLINQSKVFNIILINKIIIVIIGKREGRESRGEGLPKGAATRENHIRDETYIYLWFIHIYMNSYLYTNLRRCELMSIAKCI